MHSTSRLGCHVEWLQGNPLHAPVLGAYLQAMRAERTTRCTKRKSGDTQRDGSGTGVWHYASPEPAVRPGAVGTWRLRFVWNQSFLHLSGTTSGVRLRRLVADSLDPLVGLLFIILPFVSAE